MNQLRSQINILDDIITHVQKTMGDGYGNSILLSPPPKDTFILPAVQYLQRDNLLRIFKASPKYQQTQDLRVVASLWNKGYSWIPLPDVLALMTYAGLGLDVSLNNISFVFKEGEIQALWLHDLSRTVIYRERSPFFIPQDCGIKIVHSVEKLHQFVLTGLLKNHLGVIIDRIHTLTKLSKKTMWGNAVNASDWLFEDLQKYISYETIQTDYFTLFEQPHSVVMGGRNPLYNLLRTQQLDEPDLPTKITFRATCCLIALIPLDHKKCGNCPLMSLEERVARLRNQLKSNHEN
ncbi:siderophore-iron reductase FhuF [Cyanobacterium aponinum]|uniref:Siderophore-iron reductase FhuF n=1 Tax=Cyanobacterium aponinum 0216 TaxID=2676140 RepID=A0A844GV17_9CHRO|nr:siderophore-iron reductase FhuF [Cyanobacterium aponinum]MTF38698.1 siderophore-iron reductase FhuF [Cyanobacterium aponinum 0216]